MSEALYLKFDLNTIEHLGAKLYNSLPPILTELVANAWDADATIATINFSNDIIIIVDNGIGMTRDDAQSKYLTIGKKKRFDTCNDTTAKGRKVMGRKGIGKLAIFGISTYVTIETYAINDKGEAEATAFSIDYEKLLQQENGMYTPIEIKCSLSSPGTKITLQKLKKRKILQQAIMKSLARSLPILFTKKVNDSFVVKVNDTEITLKDRDVFEKLEAIWLFGDKEKTSPIMECIKNKIDPDKIFQLATDCKDLDIHGWFGTAKSPNILKNKELETSLNEVSIIARGKIAEQNVLPDIGKIDRMVISYMTGEIYADYLDDTANLDIATSSRQSIDRDDPRVINLFEWGKDALSEVHKAWDNLRSNAGIDELKKISPALESYYSLLNSDEKKEANKFYQLAGRIHFDDRATLYKSLTLAYEKIRRSGKTIKLAESLNNENVHLFVELVKEVEEIEQLSYYEIAKKRIDVMKKAKEYLEKNVLETECQQLIYKNLWVLNPIWEKYHTNTESVARMERAVKRDDPDEKVIKGRIDIFIAEYFEVITVIELKRPERSITYQDLLVQVTGYGYSLREEWKKTYPESKSSPKINMMVVVGKIPTGDSTDFDKLDIKLHTYQQIITNIESMYGAYLEKEQESKKFIEIIELMQTNVKEKLETNDTQVTTEVEIELETISS